MEVQQVQIALFKAKQWVQVQTHIKVHHCLQETAKGTEQKTKEKVVHLKKSIAPTAQTSSKTTLPHKKTHLH